MSLIRTRGQLRERAKREAHRRQDVGAFSDADWNSSIAEGWAFAWHSITKSDDDSFGRARLDAVIATAGPTYELPAEFAELEALYRVQGSTVYEPARLPQKQAIRSGFYDGHPPTRPGYWNLEGPGIEFDSGTAQHEPYAQRLRFWPDLGAGEILRLVYATQAPSLGDPDDPADDGLTIDLIWEPIERAVTGYARTVAATREDARELDRARTALEEAVQGMIETRSRRNGFQPWRVDLLTGGNGRGVLR